MILEEVEDPSLNLLFLTSLIGLALVVAMTILVYRYYSYRRKGREWEEFDRWEAERNKRRINMQVSTFTSLVQKVPFSFCFIFRWRAFYRTVLFSLEMKTLLSSFGAFPIQKWMKNSLESVAIINGMRRSASTDSMILFHLCVKDRIGFVSGCFLRQTFLEVQSPFFRISLFPPFGIKTKASRQWQWNRKYATRKCSWCTKLNLDSIFLTSL